MTTMPFPGVAWSAWQEVSCALVLHPLREPQKHTSVIVSHTPSVSRAAQTVENHFKITQTHCGPQWLSTGIK